MPDGVVGKTHVSDNWYLRLLDEARFVSFSTDPSVKDVTIPGMTVAFGPEELTKPHIYLLYSDDGWEIERLFTDDGSNPIFQAGESVDEPCIKCDSTETVRRFVSEPIEKETSLDISQFTVCKSCLDECIECIPDFLDEYTDEIALNRL